MESSLLGTCNHPFITLSDSNRLKPGNVAACECLADRQANKLVSVKDLRDNLFLELRQAEIKHWGKSDDLARKEAIDIGAGAET